MTSIKTRNLHTLAPLLYEEFLEHGYQRETRNGKVTRLPGTTSVEITHPKENVCLFQSRDANPFFHLIEAIAMLSGRNSNRLLSYLASNMSNFSDDNIRYNAFYGERARVKWGDQINLVIQELRAKPESRQAVVNLWDPTDLLRETRDKACNLCMIFSVEDGVLTMTTFNRSNDAVWGFGTGANMVHLPFFMEYVAGALNLSMGSWFHTSANMHVYEWNDKWTALIEDPKLTEDPYQFFQYRKISLWSGVASSWDLDNAMESLLDEMVGCIHSGKLLHTVSVPAGGPLFLREVVAPMFNIFHVRKVFMRDKSIDALTYGNAVNAFLKQMPECDWKAAANMWLSNRASSPS